MNVTLSLISHTNVGKTTLARTLLRRDVGEVMDRPHVTDLNQAYPMLELESGDRLILWDTPGFGDSARLLRRLKGTENAIGWILSQVWDRFTDRPFWCSQQAIRNVRDEADVVLYLVNATEEPDEAAYVPMEMEILSWISKPIIVLLNQTGPPRDASALRAEEAKWRHHLKRFPVIRDVVNLDAFSRCWVQEGLLLARVGPLLTPEKNHAFDALSRAWHERNWRVFEDSMAVLARQAADALCAREYLEKRSLAERIRKLLIREPLTDEERAMALLTERLSRQIAEATNELIQLHALEGKAAIEILEHVKTDFLTSEPVDEGVATVVGGCISGALTGLAADVMSGGLSLGGGAILGAILGAVGARGLAKGYNVVRGERIPYVRPSAQLFEALIRSALLRYLAVAHFGRGRGDYTEPERPKFWNAQTKAVVERRHERWAALWEKARHSTDPSAFTPELHRLSIDSTCELLARLYPETAEILKRRC